MRRADRLFQIVQLLSRRRGATARQLADRLEVSERTVYRDILDLSRSGVPIVGEAGVGYRLDPRFELPPLMFSADEIEALVLGVRMVEGWGDVDLKRSARSILDKVDAVLPERERYRLTKTALFALSLGPAQRASRHLKAFRDAVNQRRRVRVRYRDGEGRGSFRIIRPLGLYFWGQSWTVAAWCELRRGYRSFRTDRVESHKLLDQFPDESPYKLEDFVHWIAENDTPP